MTTAYVGHLFLVSLYITVLHTIPAPANLTIVSHNFRHILQWNPGIGTPPRTVFNFIKNCSYGKSTVRRNIRNTTVDVSKILKDIYDFCTFTVWASLDNITSLEVKKHIIPYEYTIIGPPVVFLSGCGGCLNISISLPTETTITNQLRQFYNSMSFNISWKKAEQSEAEHISISSKHHVLENLLPGHQYCVRVLPKTKPNSNTRPSDWQCEYTGEEEPRGVLYLLSWSLGAAVSGVGVLVLVWSLVYTGSLCKPKSPLPKSLSHIVQAHYLTPEQTLYNTVSSTEAQLTRASKNDPTKHNNNPLNVEEGSENKHHEENYANKADTEDEEDYEEENEGNYMGCLIDDSGSETNKSKKKAVVSTWPLHNSSGINQAKEATIEEIHHDEHDDRNRHLTQLESKGNEDGSGNINLFSVTLRALGPQDDEDAEEVCEPLLAQSIPEVSTSDISVPEEQTEEELLQEAKEMETEMNSDVEVDSMSGYMVTHTGNVYEQNGSLSEESDCDTDYITR